MAEGEIRAIVRTMPRSKIVALLEGASIACYDNEDLNVLEEALVVNVLDGTIAEEDLPD